jgi:DNA-directed RNA polymerase specialized sigma24 family protein
MPADKAQLIMMVGDGCSHEEMAEAFQVNIKAVGSLVKRAKTKLKNMVYERHPDLQSLAF